MDTDIHPAQPETGPDPAAAQDQTPPAQPAPPAIEVIVAADAMSAALIVTPAGPVSEELAKERLLGEFQAARIVYGVSDALLCEAVVLWRNEKRRIVLDRAAEGTAPRNGCDGSVKFLFDRRTSLAPKVNPDGTADYREVNIIHPVSKGKELARLMPPGKGTPGRTVFGKELPAKDGAPAALPWGRTRAGPARPRGLISLIDGLARWTGDSVEVDPGFVVEGDVDFSTGNIRYDKSVMINGDIKPGFRVECGGDLQVEGLIEDCALVGGSGRSASTASSARARASLRRAATSISASS